MQDVKGLPVPHKPSVPNLQTIELCRLLVREEYNEFVDDLWKCVNALYTTQTAQEIQADKLTALADDMADLIYVILYTANAFGIDMAPIWNEVQRSNMAKKGGPTAPNGKQLKPPGWTPPRLRAIIEEQMNRTSSMEPMIGDTVLFGTSHGTQTGIVQKVRINTIEILSEGVSWNILKESVVILQRPMPN